MCCLNTLSWCILLLLLLLFCYYYSLFFRYLYFVSVYSSILYFMCNASVNKTRYWCTVHVYNVEKAVFMSKYTQVSFAFKIASRSYVYVCIYRTMIKYIYMKDNMNENFILSWSYFVEHETKISKRHIQHRRSRRFEIIKYKFEFLKKRCFLYFFERVGIMHIMQNYQ